MSNLTRRALAGFIQFHLFLALLLFLPARSFRFWQAWLYWILFSASSMALTLYFLKHDPRLVGRRLAVGPVAESRRSQKILQAAASLLIWPMYVIPGIDHRFHWSAIPAPFVLAADMLVLAAWLGFFLTFRANSHAAAIVRVEEGQRVISSGPYRFVRHPMYAAAMLLFLATPVALGSPWALLAAVPVCLVIVFRLLDEEHVLSMELAGYDEYRRKVRYRLIPLVW